MKRLAYLFLLLPLFLIPHKAQAQTTQEKCSNQLTCTGFGPPVGACNGGNIYSDISVAPVVLYACKQSAWTSSAGAGGGIPYPSGTGIPQVTGGINWGTTLTAPSGAIVGTTDAQALTGKSYNGVTLNAAGSSSLFLNQAGGYTAPPGGGGLSSFTTGNLSPLFTASLGGSPTTAPALAFTLSNAAQNAVLAGPTSGTGAPTYRALVTADIPALPYAPSTTTIASTSSVLKGNGSGAAVAAVSGTDYDAPGAAATVQTNLTAEATTRGNADTAILAKTVNGKPISTNPSLNAFDVGAVVGPIAGTSVYPAGINAGTYNAMQSRIPFVPWANANCIQVAWANVANKTETAGAQMNLRAQLEYPAGTFFPIFFKGARDTVYDGSAVLKSDPVCIDVAGGAVVYVRSLMVKTNLADTTGMITNYTSPSGLNGAVKLSPNVPDATGSFDGGEYLHLATYATGNVTTTAFTDATAAPFTGLWVGNGIQIPGAGTAQSCAPFTNAAVGSGGTLYCGTITAFTNTGAVTISPAVTTPISGGTYTLVAVDKTGSGTINATVGALVLAPIALLGQTTVVKSIGFVGASQTAGVGQAIPGSQAAILAAPFTGGWAEQSVSQTNLAAGKATKVAPNVGYVQASMFGDTCANITVFHQTRYALLGLVKKVMEGDLIANDMYSAGTALDAETCQVKFWQQMAQRGAASYSGTLVPKTTSIDGWLTASGQTVLAQESIRLSINNWKRDGAPFDCATGLPAATGSSLTTVVRTNWYSNGALTTPASSGSSATCTHPANGGGTFEVANAVEVNSSNVLTQDGGFWRAETGTRVGTGVTTTASSSIITCTTCNFTSGDVGRFVAIPGAGTSGTTFTSANIATFTSSTQVSLNMVVPTAVSGGTITIDGAPLSPTGGRYENNDAGHPSAHGHAVMGAMVGAAPVAQFTW